MKHLPLVWKSLTCKKGRALFTLLTIFSAFFLYGVLAAIEKVFVGGVELAGAERLRMIHKQSVVMALPTRYLPAIQATEGVAAATYCLWFGGVYQTPRNFFPQLAVDAATHLEVYPEYLLSEEARRRWLSTRTGAIAGRALARRFEWKVGDRIPLTSAIYQRKDGTPTWELTLEGIYEGAETGVDENQLFFHHQYLEEASTSGQGEVRWFTLRLEDPRQADAVAARLDARFANSPFETRTSTEKAFIQSFANQVGNTGAMLTAIGMVVFFLILMVAATTLAQSVRERLPQLAMLKAMGYSDRHVVGLVLAESVLLCGVAGLGGLAVAWVVISGSDVLGRLAVRGLGGAFYLAPSDLARGTALIALLAATAGAFPAFSAMRLRIVDALRRG